MAALGSLCKSWGILSGWNSGGFNTGICTAFKRNGSLEWTGCWSHGADSSLVYHHRPDKLGKAGWNAKFTKLLEFSFTLFHFS